MAIMGSLILPIIVAILIMVASAFTKDEDMSDDSRDMNGKFF